MSRRYKDKRRPTSRSSYTEDGEEEESNFVDSLQSDARSEAESSALSSLLPVVTSSQVRANAPRAALPMSDVESNTSSKNQNDDFTVESNRPIDSVYIYPSDSGTSATSRQRRNYRSGQRSVASRHSHVHDGGSSRGSSGAFSGMSQASGSVGGILETLGLGSQEEDSTLGSKRAKQKGTTSSRDYYSRTTNKKSKNSDGGPQVHMRAALVLFFLMSILYGAFQWISMAKANTKLLKNKKSKRLKAKHYGAFEEGEDRPMDANLVGRFKEPSKVAKELAKVPQKDDNEDKVSKKLYAEKEKEEKQEEKPKEEEEAPADKLDAIEQKEEAKKTELSSVVQSGLSGVYTKDPSHVDIPFLWYVPRSGGGMVKNILSNCKDLVVASEVGAAEAAKGNVDKLAVIEVAGHKYINVDTTTEKGIQQAKALGLASSGLANLVVSPRIQEAAELFGPSKKGRGFTMLRHPVERAVSMFYFLKKHKVAAVASMELEDYCKSPHVENNWMVRILANKMTGDVGDADLEMAQTVLKEKLVVGLMEQKEESMRRFEYHYGWRYTENPQRQSACRSRILVGDLRTNESAKGKIKEGSQAWSLLMWQNKLDMKLYKYAKALFLQQGTELFSDMP